VPEQALAEPRGPPGPADHVTGGAGAPLGGVGRRGDGVACRAARAGDAARRRGAGARATRAAPTGCPSPTACPAATDAEPSRAPLAPPASATTAIRIYLAVRDGDGDHAAARMRDHVLAIRSIYDGLDTG
jgi:hypothetical protein